MQVHRRPTWYRKNWLCSLRGRRLQGKGGKGDFGHVAPKFTSPILSNACHASYWIWGYDFDEKGMHRYANYTNAQFIATVTEGTFKVHSIIATKMRGFHWKHPQLVRLMCILGDPGSVSRAGRKGATKVFKHRRKSPWVPTLTGPFPNGQENAGSWLGTKNALYYYAQSANSILWVLFVSSYMTVIDSITACLAHAPKKCTQSGIFQFDIKATFQNTGSLNTRA